MLTWMRHRLNWVSLVLVTLFTLEMLDVTPCPDEVAPHEDRTELGSTGTRVDVSTPSKSVVTLGLTLDLGAATVSGVPPEARSSDLPVLTCQTRDDERQSSRQDGCTCICHSSFMPHPVVSSLTPASTPMVGSPGYIPLIVQMTSADGRLIEHIPLA